MKAGEALAHNRARLREACVAFEEDVLGRSCISERHLGTVLRWASRGSTGPAHPYNGAAGALVAACRLRRSAAPAVGRCC